jgi:hypothetical protein
MRPGAPKRKKMFKRSPTDNQRGASVCADVLVYVGGQTEGRGKERVGEGGQMRAARMRRQITQTHNKQVKMKPLLSPVPSSHNKNESSATAGGQ